MLLADRVDVGFDGIAVVLLVRLPEGQENVSEIVIRRNLRA